MPDNDEKSNWDIATELFDAGVSKEVFVERMMAAAKQRDAAARARRDNLIRLGIDDYWRQMGHRGRQTARIISPRTSEQIAADMAEADAEHAADAARRQAIWHDQMSRGTANRLEAISLDLLYPKGPNWIVPGSGNVKARYATMDDWKRGVEVSQRDLDGATENLYICKQSEARLAAMNVLRLFELEPRPARSARLTHENAGARS